MKKALLIFTVLIFSLSSHSQDRGYIALSFGGNIPTGDYGSSDVTNDGSGFAKSGSINDISFSYLLSENYGFSILSRGWGNTLNASPLLHEFSQYGVNKISYDGWSNYAF